MTRYASALQMYVEEPRELNVDVLRFWRWLVLFDQLDDADKVGEMVGASSQQAREDEGA